MKSRVLTASFAVLRSSNVMRNFDGSVVCVGSFEGHVSWWRV